MTTFAQDNLNSLISSSRLGSYVYNNAEISLALERYLFNIQISQAFYPILSLLEIALRNKIDLALENAIKQNWILEELDRQDILFDGEYKKLLEAKSKLLKKGKPLIKDDIIAELSLGFWINLCTKKYKIKLWHQKNFFRMVFPHYPDFSEFDKLSKVYPLLKMMLSLRNRIFHHEIIINNVHGVQNCYENLRTLLGYISQDALLYLDRICTFKQIVAKNKNLGNSTEWK